MRVTCSNGVTVEMLGHNDVRRQRGQFRRVSANFGGIGSPPGYAAALPSPAMDLSPQYIDLLRLDRQPIAVGAHVWP